MVMQDLEITGGNNRTKNYDPQIERRSVVESPSFAEGQSPTNRILFQFAQIADIISPWGVNVYQRDLQLREFWVTEPILASAVYSTSIRNASFEWVVENSDMALPPHRNTIAAVTKMLNNAERGLGWQDFIVRLCIDYYTQDNGAFIEIIRREDNPTSPVINLATLDAGRCQRTGNPEIPVIYTNKNGVRRRLMWYQVITLEDFPSPIESLYGIQVCAVSRALQAAEIINSISIYKKEKVSGRFAGAMHLVGGASQSDIDDILAQHEENLNNRGLMRFAPPVILPALDPTHQVSHVQIDLASLPDNFNEDTALQWYVAQLAMAFGVDYQEFAPLPARSMGSSGEAEVLHLKTRGKGPATWMKNIEHMMNNTGILPSSVRFRYKVQDLRAEAEMAKARFDRGKDRALRLKNGELDAVAARELAILDGDLPRHMAEEMKKRGVPTPQAGTELGGDSFTAQQIESGIESHDERKASDLDRAEAIQNLQEIGALNLNTTITITPEEIEEQKRLLARRLLGE